MKNNKLAIKTILYVDFLFCSYLLSAQNSYSELFEGWSEERCKEYCDSVYNAMYPRAEYHESDNFIIDVETINEDIDDDASYYGVLEPPIYVDVNNSVGEIEIISEMTQSGARTYNVPLKTFPGVNGLKPELSLTYNSQQGNSSVGYGWLYPVFRKSREAIKTSIMTAFRTDNLLHSILTVKD